MPEDEQSKSGFCPICDSKVDVNATKCPECKADLTVFGIKTEGEDDIDVTFSEVGDSVEKLLGEFGEKDETEDRELLEKIMAVVDTTNGTPEEGAAVAVEDEAVAGQETVEAGEPPPPPPPEAPEAEAAPPAEGPVMFECPICNTLVDETAKNCPGCGAIFATGEEPPPEAPEAAVSDEPQMAAHPEAELADESVPIEEMPEEEPAVSVEDKAAVIEQEVVAEREEDISKKKFKLGLGRRKDRPKPPPPPRAAERKDDKALHRELADAVAEVKPLLSGARQIGINVIDGRKRIDQAIAAGKKRDFLSAIALVKESQKTIEDSITQHIIDSIQTTQMKIEALNKAGADTTGLDNKVGEVQTLLDTLKFIEAATIAQEAADNAENEVLKLKASLKKKEYAEAGKDVNEKMISLVELIKSGEDVKVNVKRTKALLTQARMAVKKNELEKAEEFLREAREDFLRELPKNLTQIISSSKPVLYKAKMQGVDIRPSIKLLKQASTALKLNHYLDALEAIKQYQKEMEQYMDA
ncbi:MAG: hypothetical protein JSW28_00705 [Thermoplasmata archaeon]|nr:MAG: hypothetical protein JSW28_00705 [Thermoplasmata archaeon]